MLQLIESSLLREEDTDYQLPKERKRPIVIDLQSRYPASIEVLEVLPYATLLETAGLKYPILSNIARKYLCVCAKINRGSHRDTEVKAKERDR